MSDSATWHVLRPGSYLGEEFQCNRGIDGNIPADTKSNKSSQDKDAIIIRRGSETQSKDGSNQHRAIEGVLST